MFVSVGKGPPTLISDAARTTNDVLYKLKINVRHKATMRFIFKYFSINPQSHIFLLLYDYNL